MDRRFLSISLRASAAAALWLAAAATPLQAKEPTRKNQLDPPPPPSLIQKLRAFLGLNPPVAIGGSRSGGELSVCLLSPWPRAPVGLSAPVLQAAGPLNEIRLERGDQLLWQRRASSTQAIEGPILWPIAPLQPGEVLTLRLRPRGASGADFASYTLRVADAESLKANQAQVDALGQNPQVWFKAFENLTPSQSPQLAALLSSPAAPVTLRQSLQCSEGVR